MLNLLFSSCWRPCNEVRERWQGICHICQVMGSWELYSGVCQLPHHASKCLDMSTHAQWRINKLIPRYALHLGSARRVIIVIFVCTFCHISLSIGTCWGCYIWSHPSEHFVLSCICICLGTKYVEVLDDTFQVLWRGTLGPAANASCPHLWSLVLIGSRLLTISQLLLATYNLGFLQKSLCSEQASHLTVVTRLCVCWIFNLPSGWQQSPEHT